MENLMLLGILTAFTICTADGIILRKDCLQFANFTYQKQNAVLQGYVIATFTNKSPSQCEAECINEYRCKSINTETAGSKTCELNSASQADKIDNVTVTSSTGWTFKSTNYTELLVGEICRAFKPCKTGEMCTDSCTCPGYTCHPCKTREIGISCLVDMTTTGLALGVGARSISNDQMTSSSYDGLSSGPWKARLNGNGAWCAKSDDKKQYLQVHLRTRKVISALAVQSKYSELSAVKQYQLQYSGDRKSWKMYTEDGLVKNFAGPSQIDETKMEYLPYYIEAYIVVFRPTEWISHICARVEVYGIDDFWAPVEPQIVALGMESRVILDSQISARTALSRNNEHPYQARLDNYQKWCAKHNNNFQFLKVEFPKRMVIAKIDVQKGASASNSAYVSFYKISYSEEAWRVIWKEYMEHSVVRVFAGPSATVSKRRAMLAHPIRVFGIKIIPTFWHKHICMRIELYGYEDPKQPAPPPGCTALEKPLGMETGLIPDSSITASSYYNEDNLPRYARLNWPKQWCDSSETNKLTEYVQVDLGKKMAITGVATQGHSGYDNWIKSYKIKYAGSNLVFQFYPSDTAPKIFDGNTDKNGIVTNKFDPRIEAQYIRVNPVTFGGNDICMRIELYGCTPT